MPLARAGDVELDYERSGSGPPLLLVMGMSGTRLHWGDPFLGLLRERFEVIAYDHRGVGASSRVEAPFTIADLAADAQALLETLGIETAHVLGISMGGMVAQELALRCPSRLTTLTLGCTYCGGLGSALATDQATRILRDAVATRDREQAVAAAWQVNVSASFAANAAQRERFMRIGLSKGVASAVVMEQMRAIAGHDTSARLGEIQTPTLILHGSEDMMLPVLNAHLIASLMPAARLEVTAGVGHLFFWEQPEWAARLVCEHATVTA
jgi:pimeloyl-ACP methyl ester carboxylesterase